MREILFRGKDVDTGEWVYGYYSGPVGACKCHEICNVNDVLGSMVDVDPETVGQYTGLEDRHGEKIFEGDMVKEIRRYSDKKGTYLVSMDVDRRGWYPFACGDGCGCCEDETLYPGYCEVIGNIHDNPELIRGTK